jgi:hypothetical protein
MVVNVSVWELRFSWRWNRRCGSLGRNVLWIFWVGTNISENIVSIFFTVAYGRHVCGVTCMYPALQQLLNQLPDFHETFCCLCWWGVSVSLNCGHTGPIAHPPNDIWARGTTVEWYWQEKQKIQRKPFPVPILPLQVKKSKAVPLHAMEALGGRGGIAPTHSRPRH